MSTTTKQLTVKINAEIDKFNSAMKQLSSSLDTAKKDFEGLSKAGEAVSGLGNKLMPFTVAVTGVATASTATAISFEGAMNKVSAISGATGKDLQSLEDMAKKMGSQTKFSASESAEALTYMGICYAQL